MKRIVSSITDERRRRIRTAFPALGSGTIFLENAGGSQVPGVVADRMHRYLVSTYVQLGAGYPLSRRSTAVVDEAHRFVSTLVNGHRGHVILGSSTTALLRMLADCYADVLEPGREIIIAETGHEANVGPWVRLEKMGLVVRWWRVDPTTYRCPIEELEALLTPRTALVAFPHVSNLLGDVVDVKAIAAAAHRVGARVVVDGVAFAPHRSIDVAAWDVDWYAYSTYKVYGPHMGALYGRRDAVAELTGPNHFFIPRDEIPYKFELGGASHEGCAGILGLGEYLRFLGMDGASRVEETSHGRPPEITGELVDGTDEGIDRETIELAGDVMLACELGPQARLIEYLQEKPGVRIIGPSATDESRVGTVSFVHERKSSREITGVVDRSGVAIRHGHMYAHRLCRALGLDPDDGVVRTSLVHYNTPEEIERLIEVLDPII